MKTYKKKIASKVISLTMAGFVFVSSIVPSFAGGKKYFLKTSVDTGGFGLLYDVVTDNATGKNTGTGGGESPYEEEKNGYYYTSVRHYGNVTTSTGDVDTSGSYLKNNFLLKINEEISPEIIEERYKNLKDGDMNAPLVFSFPGIKDGDLSATSQDYARATLVGETLVTGLNQAITFINNNSYTRLSSKNSLRYILAKLSYTSELSKNSSYSFRVGESSTGFNTINVTKANESKDKENLIPVAGLSYSDYVKIEVKNGVNGTVHSYFPWKMPKGYREGQSLFGNLTGPVQNKVKKKESSTYDENEFITWGQLILQAYVNHDTSGTAEQDYASELQTIIGQGLGSDLSRTISSTRNLLGLSSMSELILNMGARPGNYHQGVMTKDMHNIALTIYTLNLIISLLFVAFMVIKMIHQKMIATTNIVAKTSLMEGIKDLLFVATMLGFFAPLFEILLELNYLIVRTFSYSSEYMSAFALLGNTALSMESMAGFIVSTMFLSIDMYINFVYLVREITVSFLFAIAPIIIVSYLWSPTQKNLVFGYMRELVGNIFMQSFHAITMTFFSAYNSTNMSSLQALASAYTFIPITQLFRQLVLGNSGGFSEKIGGKLAGQMSSTVTGMRKAGLQAKQSRDMATAQAKLQADISKAEGSANIAGTGIKALGTIGAGALSGATMGLVGGIPGAALGALAGGVTTLISGQLGANTAKKIAESGVTKAYGEFGSVQANQANETLGMGLAELGMGLGVSSYDGAGDKMIQSGLSSVQSGASLSGKASSMADKGGKYYGESSGEDIYTNHLTDTLKSSSKEISKGISKLGEI